MAVDNVVGFAGTSDTAQIDNGTIYLDNPSTTVTVEGSGDTANSQFSGNTVGFTGSNDTAQITNGTIYTDDTSGGLNIVGSGDTVNAVAGGTQSAPVLDAQTVSDVDAIYNIVLARDPTSAELIGAQTELATGAGLNGLMSTLAGSAELQGDMASTYAAASGPYQSLMTAQPQSNEEQSVTSSAPTQPEFNAFADAMSTSYGAPIEIVSFDPNTGVQTELADTSATNLLAELPVLETEANGVNLGLKLADGTELQFASTARLTTFLYSVAVQQMQATQFVTDNYNLDMQWLNTVDQPLLQEAVFWSEAAAYFQPFDKVRAEELNIESSLALKIAGESPGSRQDLEQTINNPDTGNPTQITVYAAADGSRVHDVSGSIFGSVESLISTVLDIAAVVTGQDYLYFAAAALDAAEAGQAFSNGQDLAEILSFAQALSSGILGGTGGTTPLGTASTAAPTVAQTTAQVISTAAQAVGGVYGVVQSAENGNGAGILAGALEAAAAAAAGIGIYEGGQTQVTLNSVAAALGTAGLAANLGSDFSSGNLAQGLVDSLNLFLPAVAGAYQNWVSGSGPATQASSSTVPAQQLSLALTQDGGLPLVGLAVAEGQLAGVVIPNGVELSGQDVADLEGYLALDLDTSTEQQLNVSQQEYSMGNTLAITLPPIDLNSGTIEPSFQESITAPGTIVITSGTGVQSIYQNTTITASQTEPGAYTVSSALSAEPAGFGGQTATAAAEITANLFHPAIQFLYNAFSNDAAPEDVASIGLPVGSPNSGEVLMAAVTFGHGDRHIDPSVVPGLEDAISGALPESLPLGVFGKGVIFYGGEGYELHYYGTGMDTNVGTYWPLK